MPIDGVMCRLRPSSGKLSDKASMIFSATCAASSVVRMPGTSTTNSSPPRRATVSLARTARHKRLATSFSNWSPSCGRANR
jgi:hypothetical protein